MRISSIALLALIFSFPTGAASQEKQSETKPTIVLVHGAFAESSSWNAVILRLKEQGFSVIAAGNPLRGVKSDAVAVSAVARSVSGPVILVGHSYGGPVITEAANYAPNVEALVYVAGFAPEEGESAFSLSAKFPGSTLGRALTSVPTPDGGKDLYIRPEVFHSQFAADVPPTEAALMAATQRPVAQAALEERSGIASWKRLPTYMIYGSDDRNIPAAVLKFMAERAHAKRTVEVQGASHALMVSHPGEVATVIEEAASSL
jgi:pimeloyl-ACP methyl ester carboxylesterase